MNYLIQYYPIPKKEQKIRNIGPSLELAYPYGFFDGAAAERIGGVGFMLELNEEHTFSFSMGCGRSTNTRAELLALWALLFAAKDFGIPSLNIFGDSTVIINWVNNLASLESPCLGH